MPEALQRTLRVVAKCWVTPHLLRITLTGEALAGFPEGHESANCKLLLDNGRGQIITRTYTVRHYRADSRELDIDFFIHDAPGPASIWAADTRIGDTIQFKGPSSPKLVNTDSDWVLLAGDMSAMPALEANLERLPPETKGIAVFEIISDEDRHDIAAPDGVEVRWVLNPHPDEPNDILYEAVTAIPLALGRVAVWIAGEAGCIRKLRRYFKDEAGIERSHFYGSGYWQIGLTEDAHQIAKRSEATEA